MKVLRYQIEIIEVQEIQLPAGAQVLTIGQQYDPETMSNQIYLWAVVNPDAPPTTRRIYMVFTDQKFDLVLDYLTTMILKDGKLVIHCFVQGG